MTEMTTPLWTYLCGRCGCLSHVKVGTTRDLGRRMRSIREDRTITPPCARHRPVALLVAWLGNGPTEATLLTACEEARWINLRGHASEYLRTDHPAVRDLLAWHCPDWRSLLRRHPDELRPVLIDRTREQTMANRETP